MGVACGGDAVAVVRPRDVEHPRPQPPAQAAREILDLQQPGDHQRYADVGRVVEVAAPAAAHPNVRQREPAAVVKRQDAHAAQRPAARCGQPALIPTENGRG